MGNTYGCSWIDVLYDLDTEVRITNPSEEDMQVSKIKPKKYLVLPGTDRILFPGGILGTFEIDCEPDNRLEKGGRAIPQSNLQFPVSEAKIGSIYRITLVQEVVHACDELKKIGVEIRDAENYFPFFPGDLEKRLDSSKREFAARLRHAGLEVDSSRLYFRLVGNNPRFGSE